MEYTREFNRVLTSTQSFRDINSSSGSLNNYSPRNSTTSRPMSSVRPAGYTGSSNFDGNSSFKSDFSILTSSTRDVPEEKAKMLEYEIEEKLTICYQKSSAKDYESSLTLAKEIFEKEKKVVKLREKSGLSYSINLDLTAAVLLNLACRLYDSNIFSDALKIFKILIDNKLLPYPGRLKLNIGNIFFKRQDYSEALKFYRMALDQVPPVYLYLKLKIMQNIGLTHIELDQYREAITVYDDILSQGFSIQAALNLFVCLVKLAKREQMKVLFERFLTEGQPETKKKSFGRFNSLSFLDFDLDSSEHLDSIDRLDELHGHEDNTGLDFKETLTNMAKLFLMQEDKDQSLADFNWAIKLIQKHGIQEVYETLELQKVFILFNYGNFEEAIVSLKNMSKLEGRLSCATFNNLAYLHLLEGEIEKAEKYADEALYANRYCFEAIITRGNIEFHRKNYEHAIYYYEEALSIYAEATEAKYNLALSHVMLKQFNVALKHLENLNEKLPHNPKILYNLVVVYRELEQMKKVDEKYQELINLVKTDSNLLKEYGDFLYEHADTFGAYKYYLKSYNVNRGNLKTIVTLGDYNYQGKNYQESLKFYEKAIELDPRNILYYFIKASCLKKLNNVEDSVRVYYLIHEKFPENIDCMKYILKLDKTLDVDRRRDFKKKITQYEIYNEKLKSTDERYKLKDQTLLSSLSSPIKYKQELASAGDADSIIIASTE